MNRPLIEAVVSYLSRDIGYLANKLLADMDVTGVDGYLVPPSIKYEFRLEIDDQGGW